MTDEKPTLDQKWNLLVQEQWGKDLTDQDQEDLWVLIQQPCFVRAAIAIMGQADMQKNSLLQMNLGDPAQCHMATKIQGSVIATLQVFNKLTSFCKEKANEK